MFKQGDLMLRILKLSLMSLMVFVAGCSWLGLLDTSYGSSHEAECEKMFQEERESEAIRLNSIYAGLTKEQVISELGKPKDIKSGYSYLVDRSCFGKNCEKRMANEAWFYELEKKTSNCGRYWYSMIIYFVDGKVVKVDR